jgi:hypothetical protein
MCSRHRAICSGVGQLRSLLSHPWASETTRGRPCVHLVAPWTAAHRAMAKVVGPGTPASIVAGGGKFIITRESVGWYYTEEKLAAHTTIVDHVLNGGVPCFSAALATVIEQHSTHNEQDHDHQANGNSSHDVPHGVLHLTLARVAGLRTRAPAAAGRSEQALETNQFHYIVECVQAHRMESEVSQDTN